MKPVKVMHLIGSMDIGGAEKLTRLIIEALPREEYNSSVCCIKCGGYYADQLKEKGYPVHVLIGILKHSPVSIINSLKAFWRLYRLLRKERPDILHTHLFSASCLGRIAAKVAGVRRIITTLHRVEYPLIQSRIEQLFKGLTTLYITDSHAAASELSKRLGIHLSSIMVIYNGIDVNEFSKPPTKICARKSIGVRDEEFVLGVIAHLYREKGHAFLLDSLAAIHEKIPGLKLVIVGDGHLRGELERQAAENLPSGSVLFLGQRGDLANLLTAMDLLILPSSWEGFGLILAEAMYMNVPVITTSDGGGCAEVVAEEDGGLLVTSNDIPGMGRAILRFFGDDKFRKEQGMRGRERVERMFTVDVMGMRYAEAYRACNNT
jgi:glycosyltransferase involved in cell wall biosynthesis